MMVYVVTYQSYLYGDEYEDIKYVMEENFYVKGVFSTKEKAEDFIKKYLRKEALDFCGNDPKYRKDVKEFIDKYNDHYDIYKLELDKQNFTE